MLLTKFDTKAKASTIAIALVVIIVIGVLAVILLVPSLFPDTITAGDCADVQYIGRFAVNGTIFGSSYRDANNMTGGEPARIFVDPTKNLTIPKGYENYSSTQLPGFLQTLVGMKTGESKIVTIPANEAYGTWDTTLGLQMMGLYPVDTVLNCTVDENISWFEMTFTNVNQKVNTTFDYGAIILETPHIISATVIKVTDTNITYKLAPINGSKFIFPFFGWNATILVFNDTHLTIHSDIRVNYIVTIDPIDSYHLKVVSVNETTATFAMNIGAPSINFIDQPLTYELKVVKVYKIT